MPFGFIVVLGLAAAGASAVLLWLVARRRTGARRAVSLRAVSWTDESPTVERAAMAVADLPVTGAQPAQLPPPPAPQAPVPNAVQCPSCRRDYPGGMRFCPYDARPLGPPVEAPSGAWSEHPVGRMICPRCRRLFEAASRFCTFDAEPLVASALGAKRVGSDAGLELLLGGGATGDATGVVLSTAGKICPDCAQKYDGEATFCGRDGSPLVSVN